MVAGLACHTLVMSRIIFVPGGIQLSLANSVSFVGLQLGIIALIGSWEPRLRGLVAGLLILAAIATAFTNTQPTGDHVASGWEMQAHILISLFAYGLLTVGAIVAVFALAQERRLRSANLDDASALFAPLLTTERLLFGIAATGCLTLLLAVLSGLLFVNDLFAQHLVHKTVLSIAALLMFGVLLAGRRFAGWRGRRAISLYLWGFVTLGLAYFGSRFVLEILLGRSWG